MKIKLSWVLAAATLVLGMTLVNVYTGFAQTDTGDYKIGVVDVQKAMDAYTVRQQEVSELDAEVADTREKLADLEETLQSRVEAYAEERPELSEEEQMEREAQLDREKLELDMEVRQAEAQLQRKRRRLKQRLVGDIVAAVEGIGVAENYHLIFEADPNAPAGVLYHTNAIDITNKVVDRLNN
jgi:Skp family chaperone for outer membrane proteins